MTKDQKNIVTIILISTFTLFPILGLIALATYLIGIILMFVWDVGSLITKVLVVFVSLALIALYLSSVLLVHIQNQSNIKQEAQTRMIN